MNKPLAFATSLVTLLAASSAHAAIVQLTATLNGAQETPAPVVTNATGTATLTYDDVTKLLNGTITMTNIVGVNNQHIHAGACGAAGAPVVTLSAPVASVITIVNQNMATNETALLTGALYINIHTGVNTGGEIRGQIRMAGTANNCPPGAADAGTDASTSSSGGTDGGSSSGGSSSGGSSSGGSSSGGSSSGETNTSSSSGGSSDDGGCNSSGDSSGNGLALAMGVGLAFAVGGRLRRRRR